jgi:hypothetical protein
MGSSFFSDWVIPKFKIQMPNECQMSKFKSEERNSTVPKTPQCNKINGLTPFSGFNGAGESTKRRNKGAGELFSVLS